MNHMLPMYLLHENNHCNVNTLVLYVSEGIAGYLNLQSHDPLQGVKGEGGEGGNQVAICHIH